MPILSKTVVTGLNVRSMSRSIGEGMELYNHIAFEVKLIFANTSAK